MPTHINECVGRAQIDGQVIGEHAAKLLEHRGIGPLKVGRGGGISLATAPPASKENQRFRSDSSIQQASGAAPRGPGDKSGPGGRSPGPGRRPPRRVRARTRIGPIRPSAAPQAGAGRGRGGLASSPIARHPRAGDAKNWPPARPAATLRRRAVTHRPLLCSPPVRARHDDSNKNLSG
ncbi:hypothetical protein LG3211_4464 [Lysobacter gummosus]|nr:hypothetical protein LG3211_4464 [Lysobacter gummosus]